jgi:hypothetical protein
MAKHWSQMYMSYAASLVDHFGVNWFTQASATRSMHLSKTDHGLLLRSVAFNPTPGVVVFRAVSAPALRSFMNASCVVTSAWVPVGVTCPPTSVFEIPVADLLHLHKYAGMSCATV